MDSKRNLVSRRNLIGERVEDVSTKIDMVAELIDTNLIGEQVSWNPTGDRVAIISKDRAFCIVFSIDLVNGTLIEVARNVDAHHHLTDVAWSPTGDRIAVGSTGNLAPCVIYSIDESIGVLIRVANSSWLDGGLQDASAPSIAWNPLGDRIATLGFARNSCHVYSIDEVSSTMTRVASVFNIGGSSGMWDNLGTVRDISWNSMGNRIAVTNSGGLFDGSCFIFSIDEISGILTEVASTTDNSRIRVPTSVKWNSTGDRVAISAFISNSCIIFSIDEINGILIEIAGVVNGNRNRYFGRVESMSWNPIDNEVVVYEWRNNLFTIFSIDEVRGVLVEVASSNITPSQSWYGEVSWSPTGKQIVTADQSVVRVFDINKFYLFKLIGRII